MASKHQLSLELPDTNNIKVLRLFDTSLYAPDLAVDCGTLRITSPGFNLPVAIEILKGFNIVLNACSLGLQRTSCQDASQPLPDGIYVINHLRTTQTTNKYFNLLCDLEMSGCEPGADIKEKLEELRLIKSFIDAAKAKVEYGHEPQAGMELLIYAQKRLNRYATECAC
jgi:hypothetical protein